MGNLIFAKPLPDANLPWEQPDWLVNHDTGGKDAMRVTDVDGNGVENVSIRLYVKSELDANASAAKVRSEVKTLPDGRWSTFFTVNPQTAYVVVFYKDGFTTTRDIPAKAGG